MKFQINKDTKIADLLKQFPELQKKLGEFNEKFQNLANPVMRNTIGKIATIEMMAGKAKIELKDLMAFINGEIEKYSPMSRKEKLKSILRDLHKGAPESEIQERFNEFAGELSASEIAEIEQELTGEGVTSEEIKGLCNVHAKMFESVMPVKKSRDDLPNWHPMRTLLLENEEFKKECAKLSDEVFQLKIQNGEKLNATFSKIENIFDRIMRVEIHYLRKENQIFPFMERHGITAPPKVMWGVHDDNRKIFRKFLALLKNENRNADIEKQKIVDAIPEVVKVVLDMIDKEENIMIDMCLETFSEDEWKAIRKGENEIGFALIAVPEDVDYNGIGAGMNVQSQKGVANTNEIYYGKQPRVELDVGMMTLEQINLMLKHLPLDLSYVNENDEVIYYSGIEDRIFPRSPGVIGRKVQNCHPPKSVGTVEKILASFKDGSKNVAEFWLELGGKFLYIRYFAIRDEGKNYRGCLEVMQDITNIRKIEGKRTLLDW